LVVLGGLRNSEQQHALTEAPGIKHLFIPSVLAGRRTNSICMTPKDSKADFPEMESSYSQTCLRSPAEHPLPLGNSLSHAPLHVANNNNNSSSVALHGLQLRGSRLKVKGKKCTLRRYVLSIDAFLN